MTTPVERGTPLAIAIQRAMSASDAEAADAAYQEALGMADGETAVSVARDHVADLLRWQAYPMALKRCTEHCENVPGDRILLLTRAEARCAVGDYRGAGQDVDELGSFAAAGERARLLRIRGLIAADRHDVAAATDLFDRAEKLFAAAGHTEGQAVIAHDRAILGVLRGDQGTVAEVLAADPPRTPAERLLLSQALRRELRYERALALLTELADTDSMLLPALRKEMTDLRRLLREYGDDELVPSAGADPDSPRFDRRLQHVRRQVLMSRELLRESRPAEAAVGAKRAEGALLELRAAAVTAAETGSLAPVRGRDGAGARCVTRAGGHIGRRDRLGGARGGRPPERCRTAGGHRRHGRGARARSPFAGPRQGTAGERRGCG
jgi:tetratricopeptide (TPR) repeat protein